ncbi:MAG: hypothetical protein KJ725_09760 [Gammaproteobacteria bacterium]|uniref:hypothetical protein n=1 Tax=Methylotuvimicrobium sp. TaxID=2822413 RepID=UPI001D1E9B0B|nr:hypothetical protein [Gammaproteobacteria bacterium]
MRYEKLQFLETGKQELAEEFPKPELENSEFPIPSNPLSVHHSRDNPASQVR